MSHNKERTDKTCLNCGAQLQGRYCHVCGQENIEPKENFGHLISHFFKDVTHFDGNFFSTLKLLLLKPGFLSSEYLRGRRASYLNPIRMYIFTAFVFFLVLFSTRTSQHTVSVESSKDHYTVIKDSLQLQLGLTKDSSQIKILKAQLADINKKTPSKNKVAFRNEDSGFSFFKINFDDEPGTIGAYDSAQTRLPIDKRDGWLMRRINKKSILIGQQYKNRQGEFIKELTENFTHDIPKMMFIFLPLVALILQLLYVRRKEFYYVSHGIFVIHIYIATYILMLTGIFFGWLQDLSGWGVFNFLKIISILAIFFYTYKAMRNFYHQRRAKTIIKFFIFIIGVLILFILLSLLLLGISLYQV